MAPCSSHCEVCMPMSSWNHPLITLPGDCLRPTSWKLLELTDVTWPEHCHSTDTKQTWENRADTQCFEDMDPGLLIMKQGIQLAIYSKENSQFFSPILKKIEQNPTAADLRALNEREWWAVLGCSQPHSTFIAWKMCQLGVTLDPVSTPQTSAIPIHLLSFTTCWQMLINVLENLQEWWLLVNA